MVLDGVELNLIIILDPSQSMLEDRQASDQLDMYISLNFVIGQ